MRNLHKIILEQYGMEALHLLRDWEKLQIRDCNYRNHRIFTLRCISKGLIPVSISLKATIKTEEASKIIKKAEKDNLQARVKSINSLLGYNAKQRDLIRAKLGSILPSTSMKECQELIDKVSEFRHSKVVQRQIYKFNKLMQKEGNIIWPSLQGAQASTSPWAARASSPEAGSTPPQQPGLVLPRQAGALSRQLGLVHPRQAAPLCRQLILIPPIRQVFPGKKHWFPAKDSFPGRQHCFPVN